MKHFIIIGVIVFIMVAFCFTAIYAYKGARHELDKSSKH